MIKDRVAEFPDMTLADHEQVIERNFRAHWWDGPAQSPSLFYKSRAQFERCQASDGQPSARRLRELKKEESDAQDAQLLEAMMRRRGLAADAPADDFIEGTANEEASDTLKQALPSPKDTDRVWVA